MNPTNLPNAVAAETRPALAPLPSLIGLATCFRMGFEGQHLMPLADTLLQRAHANALDANALMDLSVLLQLQGLREEGLRTLALALHVQQLYTLQAELPSRLTLLAIMTPGDLMANAPLPFLFEHADITLHMLYLMPGEPLPTELPTHDVAFIAISDSSRTRGLLRQLSPALPTWPRPVLNAPEGILCTSRLIAFNLLKDAPGIVMAPTVQATRAQLEQACAQGRMALAALLPNADFPVIIRPIDSHAGRGLEKTDDWASLTQYLIDQADDAFYVSLFMDYRSPDGLFRKYRVVLIDGEPFAGHMGVSQHWMIHYLNAGMTDSAEKRAEEAAFMQYFDATFAQRHRTALACIHARFGLDYLVIDCAETAAGELLVFELDPGAVVHSMDPPEQFGYKHPAMQKVFEAFRALLFQAAQSDQRFGQKSGQVSEPVRPSC
jgi:hypothetical protein